MGSGGRVDAQDIPSRGGGVCPSGSAGSSGLQDALRCCGSVEGTGQAAHGSLSLGRGLCVYGLET